MKMSYIKYTSLITSIGYTPLTSEKEFKNDKISWICNNGHTTSMTLNSYNNKTSRYKNNKISTMCTQCKFEDELAEKLIKEREYIKELCGHELLKIIPDSSKYIYIYKCKSCGKENETDVSSLKKNKGNCLNCQPQRTKLSIESLSSRLEIDGYKIVEYNGKSDVIMKCPNNHTFKTATFAFEKRHRRCPNC
jgi:hypothetical protein